MERKQLAAELLAMRADDEATRSRLSQEASFWHGYHPEMRAVHRRNGDRLDAMFDALGCWPGFELVGHDGSEAAWFIANHDIASPVVMRRARDLMTEAVDAGQASTTQLAYLVDRIAYFENTHQIYGTQRGWDDNGNFGVWPQLVDPDSVDERRRNVGLSSLATAASLGDADNARPTQLSPQELEDLRQGELAFVASVGWRID